MDGKRLLSPRRAATSWLRISELLRVKEKIAKSSGNNGREPEDFKPMAVVGPGAYEIRVRDTTGAFRAIYVAKLVDAIYVLHVFQKKTQATSKYDIELARKRYRALMQKR